MGSAYREKLKDEMVKSPMDLEVLLERITWRPDTKVRIEPGRLIVRMRVPDTYNPGRTTIVTHARPLRETGMGYGDFHVASVDWWCNRIIHELDAVDRHETREWFKVDGEMIYNPHEVR